MSGKKKAAGAIEAPVVVPTVSEAPAVAVAGVAPSYAVAVAPDRRVRSVEVQVDALEQIIAEAQRQIVALRNPFQEFPKLVKGHTFASRAEQDAAGPEYAD